MRVYLVNVNLTASGAVKEFLNEIISCRGGGKNKILNEMKLYLAGGYTGNLKPLFDKYIKLLSSSPKSLNEAMKCFLVNPSSRTYGLDETALKDVNILESYYYIRKAEAFMAIAKNLGSFMLDSGAFTFMNGYKGAVDWDAYIREYAAFINRHNIELFIEVDIDSIVGLKEVERLRRELESMTGKKPIPVWHKNRGKDYFLKMCDEYPYVAIGGIVTREIPRNIYENAFPWFIKEAHRRGAKIHGLGYTGITRLKESHFDSVDSTAWLHGNRGGWVYKFNPHSGLMEKVTGTGRLKAREGAVANFCEWIKFSKYADLYL